MPVGLSLSLSGYKFFIQQFRAQCTRSAGTFDVHYGDSKSFQFRKSDEYLCAVQNGVGGAWIPLTNDQGHYSHMADVAEFTREGLELALMSNFTKGYDQWSAALRQIIVATAEAARSAVVYRKVQDMLQGKPFTWKSVHPYLDQYRKTRELNGVAPGTFKVLDLGDYRGESFMLTAKNDGLFDT